MTSPITAQQVIQILSETSGFSTGDLEAHLDDDLTTDLGFDSIKIMEAWAKIESGAGLDIGVIGSQQSISIRCLIERVQRATDLCPPQSRPGEN